MGQYSMNAYDADIYIRQFKGLISNGNDPDGNLEYAVEAKNVDTTDGFLQPAADPAVVKLIRENDEDFGQYNSLDEMLLDTSLDYWRQIQEGKPEEEPIYPPLTPEQMEVIKNNFYKYYTGSEVRVSSDDFVSKIRYAGKFDFNADGFCCTVYVFSCGNGFMYFTDEETIHVFNDGYLRPYGPLAVTGLYKMDGTVDKNYRESWNSTFEKDIMWSSVVFQSSETAEHDPYTPVIPKGSTDVGIEYVYGDKALYLSSSKGLYVVQAYLVKVIYQGEASYLRFIIECNKIETPVNFEHIEAFGDRLWGIPEKNDALYYSALYGPFDWSQNEDFPEKGSGQINEPNWDSDYFTGLRAFGNSLLAFKKHRVWKVNGVDFGAMVISEQYGFGTEFIETVVTSGERIYFANGNGLAIFDGTTVRPLMQDNLRNLWSKIRKSAMGKMCAFLYENRKYCLAVPVDSDENNTLIVYDTIDGTVFFYEDMNITSFMHPILSQEPIVLWNDGNLSNLMRFDFNAWEKNLSGSRATKWVTPWIELGRKDIQKGGHDFYFTPEVKGENAVTFTISFQTEKKTKTKQYTVQPMTAAEIAAGKQGKTKRLHFGGTGRRFRIIIETPSGVDAGKAYKWRLYGGIHLITEIDKD